MIKEDLRIWTDDLDDKRKLRGFVPLPKGLKNAKCVKCDGSNLTGAIITETADEDDPNILCIDCKYWRD